MDPRFSPRFPLRYRLRDTGQAPAGTIATGAHLPVHTTITTPAPAGSVFVDDPTVSANAAYDINAPAPAQTPAPWYQQPWMWLAAGVGALLLATSGGRRARR